LTRCRRRTHLMGARPRQACAPRGLQRPVHRPGASLGRPRQRSSSAPLHPPSPSTGPHLSLVSVDSSDAALHRARSSPRPDGASKRQSPARHWGARSASKARPRWRPRPEAVTRYRLDSPRILRPTSSHAAPRCAASNHAGGAHWGHMRPNRVRRPCCQLRGLHQAPAVDRRVRAAAPPGAASTAGAPRKVLCGYGVATDDAEAIRVLLCHWRRHVSCPQRLLHLLGSWMALMGEGVFHVHVINFHPLAEDEVAHLPELSVSSLSRRCLDRRRQSRRCRVPSRHASRQ